ncbi:23S rRNA (adenine(2503)-C(2))-methyltransferase RlmN [Magnetospira thiophila]
MTQTTTDSRTDLLGLTRDQLQAELQAFGEKPFRAKQLWHWIYHQGETDFGRMTTLAKPLRERMAEHYRVGRPILAREQKSADGTAKWLVRFEDGNEAETVHIPEEDRGAVCISTQVGCTLTCRFCHTGTQLLVRNLSAGEIVGQFMTARDACGEWPTPNDGSRKLTNIVVMGMGEPLFNYEAVRDAMLIAMDSEGLGISRRRITLSTSGVVPMMRRYGEEVNTDLAISLHAVTDDLRDELMPINKKYPLDELLRACRDYPGASNARRITFEYLLLKGINDSEADARELARRLKDLPAKVNLLPFNSWPGCGYEPSSAHTMKKFSNLLNDLGLSAPIRSPRGRDIMAACGQLKSESQREPKSRQRARLEAGIVDDSHAS